MFVDNFQTTVIMGLLQIQLSYQHRNNDAQAAMGHFVT